MKKSVIAAIISLTAVLTCLLCLCGCERKSMEPTKPSVTGIDSGYLNSNIGLEKSFKLNKSNGKYVNLYVENNGSNSIVATINGQSEKHIKSGENDCIYLEVTQGFLGLDKEYEFKVVSGANGGSISINYEIVQQDELKEGT